MKYNINRPIELRASRGVYGFCEVYFIEYRIPPKNLIERIFDGRWKRIYKYFYIDDYEKFSPYDCSITHWMPIFWRKSSIYMEFGTPKEMLERYKKRFKTFGDIIDFNNEQSELRQKVIREYNEYHKINHPENIY